MKWLVTLRSQEGESEKGTEKNVSAFLLRWESGAVYSHFPLCSSHQGNFLDKDDETQGNGSLWLRLQTGPSGSFR